MPEDLTIRLGLDASGFLNGVGTVQRNTTSLSQSLAQMAQGAQRQIESGMSIMTRLDLVQITVAQSARRVTEAQEKYNQALLDFGPGSKQAIAAQKEMVAANEAQEKTQARAHLSYVLIAGDLLTMGVRLPQVVNGLHAMGTASLMAARNLTAVQVAGGAAMAAVAAFTVFLALSTDEVERGATATEELALAQEAMNEQIENNSHNLFGGPVLGGLEKIAGKIPGITTATEEWENAERRLADAQAAVDLENRAVAARNYAQAQAQAAQAAADLERRNNALVSSVRGGFSMMGIDLQVFSQAFQEEMLKTAGVSEEFVASLRPVVDVEAMLKAASGETGEALRKQASITAHKDETTEAFNARLKELGFTEEDIKARIDETGRALLSQAEATRRAAMATSQGFGSAGGGVVGANFRTNYGGELSGLPAFLEANKHNIVAQLTGHAAGSYLGQINAGRFNGSAIADALMGRTTGQEIGNVAGYFVGPAGSNSRTRLQEIIKTLVMASLPANQWDSILSQAHVPGFAHGFDGIVKGPSLFMAGEHGPERVRVGKPGDDEGPSGSTVVFQPGAIVVNGQKADDLVRTLRRLGVGG